MDTITQLQVQGIFSNDTSLSPAIRPKDIGNPYSKLLCEYPHLTQVYSQIQDTPIRHDVTHHIETTGPPVATCPSRLAPDCLKVAKQLFDHTYVAVRYHTPLLKCLSICIAHSKQQETGDLVVTTDH